MLIGMKYRERHSEPQLESLNLETASGRGGRTLSLKSPSEISHEINRRFSNEQLLNTIDQIE